MSRAVLPLDRQCLVAGLAMPQPEYRFCPPRRFRFDYAWPEHLLAAEVDGAIWVQGRHTRGAGVEADMEKFNLALEHGWRVARFSTAMVADGRALATLERLLKV